MQARNTRAEYGAVSMGFHWLVVVLLLFQYPIIFIAHELEKGPLKSSLYFYHKSIGVTLLLVMLLRLGWRWMNPRPALPTDMAEWEKRLANTVHYLLYAGIIAMPLLGWFMSSAGGHDVPFWGLFTLPHLIGENEALGEILHELHEIVGLGVLGLIGLHVLAGLRHHFIRKDNVLRRMVPFGGTRP